MATYPTSTHVTKQHFGWSVSYHGRKLGNVHWNGRGWSAADATGRPIGVAKSKDQAVAMVWSREYSEIRGQALDAGIARGEYRSKQRLTGNPRKDDKIEENRRRHAAQAQQRTSRGRFA